MRTREVEQITEMCTAAKKMTTVAALYVHSLVHCIRAES